MKQIEITTSQHVTIRYKLGTVIDRILAFIIDILIVSLTVFIILLGIRATNLFSDNFDMTLYFFVFPMLLFYHLIMEAFGGGRSFGKKALKLKPVKKNGAEMTFLDYFMRWIFRIPDILFSLGTLAVIMISSSSSAQRLGDLLADTVVIKTDDSNKFGLSWMLKMNNKQKSYKPSYPEVSQLAEKDILLIKEVADRYGQYRNQASREALDKMTKKVEEQLNINAPDNKHQFMKNIITDYVFLTR